MKNQSFITSNIQSYALGLIDDFSKFRLAIGLLPFSYLILGVFGRASQLRNK